MHRDQQSGPKEQEHRGGEGISWGTVFTEANQAFMRNDRCNGTLKCCLPRQHPRSVLWKEIFRRAEQHLELAVRLGVEGENPSNNGRKKLHFVYFSDRRQNFWYTRQKCFLIPRELHCCSCCWIGSPRRTAALLAAGSTAGCCCPCDGSSAVRAGWPFAFHWKWIQYQLLLCLGEIPALKRPKSGKTFCKTFLPIEIPFL